ncbi:si:ch211-191a24.3 [Cololabis saira]|uniref:si:ch211-191a24.3 n=1 Tax=Cololabis saira TaxID=129043 RepID=UPI002AD454A8|nr:si:ch211-191a24.3 [Cololabis saira]
MDELRQIDLTYITERIITVLCPPSGPEDVYLQNLKEIVQMLQSKHGHNYMLINLSQKHDALSRMNHKVLDTGWLDRLAPSLDQIFYVCTTMENWLQSNPKHMLVLHCRGGKGRLGVLVASYIHFSNISASADLSLDHFAMRKFYTDKLSSLMTPSQKRYVWMLGSMLKRGLRMSPSPSFLLCVVLHGLPKLRPDGGCCLFLRVYQNMQAVYTSPVYCANAAQTDRLYFVLKPAQLLKGDIMVVCYHKILGSGSRQVVLRLQLHSGLVVGHSLSFSKADLDCASEDPSFPDDGKLELLFSESPEKITGRELWHNGFFVTVDYDTSEPLVRRDSYQDLSQDPSQDPSQHPSQHQTAASEAERTAVGPGAGREAAHPPLSLSLSLFPSARHLFLFSSLPPRLPREASARHPVSPVKVSAAGKVSCCVVQLTGDDVPPARRPSVRPSPSELGGLRTSGPGDGSVYARVRKRSSEEGASSPSSDSGLSVASQGRTTAGQRAGAAPDQSPQERIPGVDLDPPPGVMTDLAPPAGGEMAGLHQRGVNGERETDILDDEDDTGPSSSGCSLSSENLPEAQRSEHTEYSTHSWVRHQQTVDVRDGESRPAGKRRPPPLVVPDTPPRGLSSRAAVQRAPGDEHDVTDNSSSCQEEELASLATDIDESLEQLNQIILDLDPTFIPVPTRCSPLSRTASLQANGFSHKGSPHLPDWKQHQQVSDDYAGPRSPGQGGRPPRAGGSPASPQHGLLTKTNSVDHYSQVHASRIVLSTPAFPVSPPTPYVKNFSELSGLRTGGQWDQSWTQDSRGFLDGMNHAGGSADGDLFRSEVPATPASCQRIFGSMCSVSSGSPLPHTDSSTPPPVWHDRTPNSQNSPYPPQPSPPFPPRTPNAHSSPRDPVKGLGGLGGLGGSPGVRRGTDATDFSSLLGNGDLEHSLLEAMEGLGSLNLGLDGRLDLGVAPLLPEKRRVMEGGDVGSRSPSLSGFSSPYSGSSISIPFSSSLSLDPLRGLSGASSPGADSGSKQDTVKFVQDTSKFWYKPDISRDQAIAVLKDKEPGAFVVRDSHSFRGAYGLAMKVATPPPSVVQQSKKVGDLSNELVRHFLIECTQKGVRLKGCPNEPYFGSLTALVCQHSITPLALPCKLILPDRDPTEELSDSSPQTSTNSAADLLKQGAACNVWFLGSVELESLTGHQAVQKAATLTLSADPPPASTVVHFKVSAQGITLTDNQRKLFFRRHYAVNTVIFCSLDPKERKWTRDSGSTAKIFGFVARKSQSDTENVCHLFAEHDPEQPASAIVNFVSKVMIGSHKK